MWEQQLEENYGPWSDRTACQPFNLWRSCAEKTTWTYTYHFHNPSKGSFRRRANTATQGKGPDLYALQQLFGDWCRLDKGRVAVTQYPNMTNNFLALHVSHFKKLLYYEQKSYQPCWQCPRQTTKFPILVLSLSVLNQKKKNKWHTFVLGIKIYSNSKKHSLIGAT